MLAKDLKYISSDEFDKLNWVVIKLGKKLLFFIKYIEGEDNRIYK